MGDDDHAEVAIGFEGPLRAQTDRAQGMAAQAGQHGEVLGRVFVGWACSVYSKYTVRACIYWRALLARELPNVCLCARSARPRVERRG